MNAAVEIFPIAIGHYDNFGPLDVDTQVRRVAKLLAEFGGEVLRQWAVPMGDRGGDAVAARLSAWREREACPTVLYWVGHGWSDTKTAALAHAHSDRHVGATGISPEMLAEAIVRWETKATDGAWLLVIIDACRSARFAELLAAAVDNLGGRRRRVIVLGTSADASTTLGRFSRALDVAFRHTFAGNQQILIVQLVAEIARRVGGEWRISNLGADTVLRPIVPIAPGYNGPLDARRQLNAAIRDLPDDERRHFLTKAQGGDLEADGDVFGELTWHFSGRARERRIVVNKLGRDGLVVVTGKAGSGKSALLGDILVRSRPSLAEVLLDHGLLTPAAHEQPPPFDSAVHLTGLTAGQLTSRICADLGLDEASMDQPFAAQLDEFERLVGSRPGRSQILVDALDEAVEPVQVAAVLRRLGAIPCVCLVVGTRPSTREGPDQPDPDNTDLLDALGIPLERADSIEPDPDGAFDYVRRRLNALVTNSRVSAPEVEAAARQVVAVGQEFLYARLVTHELLARPELVKAADLVEQLGNDHRAVFAAAVDRLSRDNAAYKPLLQALAVAQGRGAPIRDGVWATLASAIASYAVSDGAIHELVEAAAPYLALDHEHGQTVYRLAHRTFAEHFVGDSQTIRSWHGRIVRRAIIELEGTSDNPYWIHHTSGHCVAGGLSTWNTVAQSEVLDTLDPIAVASDAMRSLFARGPMPVNLAAIVAGAHQLRAAPKSERVGIRQLAAARIEGSFLTETPHSEAAWAVAWAVISKRPQQAVLAAHHSAVHAVAAVPLPDGRILLATGGYDGTVRLWDPATATPVGGPLIGHVGDEGASDALVFAVAAVPMRDGRILLASSGIDRSFTQTIRLWDPATGIPVGKPLTGHGDLVHALAAVSLPTGQVLLATGANDGLVQLWDLATGTPVGKPFTAHHGRVTALAAVPLSSGQVLLATGGSDGLVQLWDPATGTPVGDPWADHVVDGFGYVIGVSALAAVSLPSGQVLLAASGNDGLVRLWHPATGTPATNQWVVSDGSGQRGGVWALAAVPLVGGRDLLASGDSNGAVRLWDPATGASVSGPLTGHDGGVWALAAVPLPDGRVLLASGGDDGTVRLWDLATHIRGREPWPGHRVERFSAVAAISLRDGLVLLASGDDDGWVRLWDAATGTPVGGPLGRHHGGVYALAAVSLPDGRVLLASGAYGVVQLWDPITGTPVGQPLTGHDRVVRALAAVPVSDGRVLLASGDDDGWVRLWDTATGTPVGGSVDRHHGGAYALAAVPLPDGRVLLASRGSGTVQLWDPTTGRPIGHPLTGHDHGEHALAAVPLPDGRVLLASGGYRTVQLWDPTTGTPVGHPLTCIDEAHRQMPHNHGVHALAAVPLPDGRVLLASGGCDGSLRLWDADVGSCVLSIPLGADVRFLAPLSTGRIAVAMADGLAVIKIKDQIETGAIKDKQN